MGNGLGLGSMNTFLTPPSHRPKAARDVPDNGLPAGVNMDVSDLHSAACVSRCLARSLRKSHQLTTCLPLVQPPSPPPR